MNIHIWAASADWPPGRAKWLMSLWWEPKAERPYGDMEPRAWRGPLLFTFNELTLGRTSSARSALIPSEGSTPILVAPTTSPGLPKVSPALMAQRGMSSWPPPLEGTPHPGPVQHAAEFLPLRGGERSHCMSMPRFVYPLTNPGAPGCLPPVAHCQ